MPRYELTDDQILDESKKLFLAQAEAYYRDLQLAAQNAPKGKVIRLAEAFAQEAGRELVRQSVENIVQVQNDLLEKKRTPAMCLRMQTQTLRIPTAPHLDLRW